MEFPPTTRNAHKGSGHRVAAVIGFAVLMALTVSACARNSSSAGGAALSVAELRAAPEHGTLSREHSVTVEVPETELDARFQRLAFSAAPRTLHRRRSSALGLSRSRYSAGSS
jgi:hypothetical protein